MRSILVVVAAPALADLTCLEDFPKALEIEQFIADSAVERLRIGVLRRLAGLNEVQGHAVLSRSAQHCVAREL